VADQIHSEFINLIDEERRVSMYDIFNINRTKTLLKKPFIGVFLFQILKVKVDFVLLNKYRTSLLEFNWKAHFKNR